MRLERAAQAKATFDATHQRRQRAETEASPSEPHSNDAQTADNSTLRPKWRPQTQETRPPPGRGRGTHMTLPAWHTQRTTLGAGRAAAKTMTTRGHHNIMQQELIAAKAQAAVADDEKKRYPSGLDTER